jgi:hypothetical protein
MDLLGVRADRIDEQIDELEKEIKKLETIAKLPISLYFKFVSELSDNLKNVKEMEGIERFEQIIINVEKVIVKYKPILTELKQSGNYG